MSTFPELPDICWDVDTSCDPGFEDLDPDVQDRAIALATTTLYSLTAGRVGGCPKTVRPCVGHSACETSVYGPYTHGFYPLNWNGAWSNCGCTGGCVHNGLHLPPPVGRIDAVTIDGAALDPADYRLIDGRTLIRTDGSPWPATNDLTLPDTEPGTWSVTYLNAYPVDTNGAYAAGVLASEYAKACTTGKCELPTGVTQVARAGIVYTMTAGAFPGGFTGIRVVDAFIRQWNPSGHKSMPSVLTPQTGRGLHGWR
jgi:hypothetical protein